MSVCPNCGRKITCGCQRRTAVNGQQCCTKCVESVNAKYGTKSDNNLTPKRKYLP